MPPKAFNNVHLEQSWNVYLLFLMSLCFLHHLGYKIFSNLCKSSPTFGDNACFSCELASFHEFFF